MKYLLTLYVLIAPPIFARAGHGYNSGYTSHYSGYSRGSHSMYNSPSSSTYTYGNRTYTLTVKTPSSHISQPPPLGTRSANHYPKNDGSKIFNAGK